MELTSTSNPKVKYWQKLLTRKYRKEEKIFLVEDEHLVNEALKRKIVKEIITITDNQYGVDTYKVTPQIMKLLSSQVSSTKVIAVCYELEEKEVNGNVIILDNLQDPGNLGTIIRSAVAFNFDTIVLSDDSVDLYNPKVIRASEGMIFNINIKRCNLKEFIPTLKNDYTLITTDVNGGKDIRNIKYQNIALVIGNEGNGVSQEIADLCDEKVYIKMNNNCESLNAGICASILMYEVSHE